MSNAPGGSFRPSVHGCEFANSEIVHLPITLGPIPIARVTGGLCGGMVLDSLRSWHRNRPPAGRSSADLRRVFGAQLRSFQIPSAPWRYLCLQQPRALIQRRKANLQALKVIMRHLRQGQPVPVALVCRLSRNPLALAAHHVVLAYRLIERDPHSATFAVYDPNRPGDDGVQLRIGAERIEHSRRRDVHAAFVLHAR